MMSKPVLTLEQLRHGEWADVEDVVGDASLIARLAELGVRAGSRLQVLQPGSPCLIQIGGARLSVRGDSCLLVLVRPV